MHILLYELKGVEQIISNLTLGSLFDGIGGFPLSAKRYNIKTLWSSEIDKNCNKLLHNKFSDVIQLGNIQKIKGNKIQPVDIITFGSPCNNLSLAGNKKGLNGEKSVLFYDAIRIINEMRNATNNEYPRYAIWENVTGALSSNKGQDFRCVLEAITKTQISIPKSQRWANAGLVRGNECSFAWRVFDSQYWGVPQSRKRIFLVADFRGQSAGQILFEQSSQTRNIEKSQTIKEKIISNNAESIRTTGEGKHITSTLFASYGTKWNGNNGAYTGSHFVLEKDGRLRRFTPLECERLMGFPDNWTEGFKDTVRYRMLGNSVAIPCVKWIINQIVTSQ